MLSSCLLRSGTLVRRVLTPPFSCAILGEGGFMGSQYGPAHVLGYAKKVGLFHGHS